MSEEKWIPKPKKSPVKRVKQVIIYRDIETSTTLDAIALALLMFTGFFSGLYVAYKTPDPIFKAIITLLAFILVMLINRTSYTKETYIEE
jgi:hypothetical protein